MDARDPRAARFRRAVEERNTDGLRALFAEHVELCDVVDAPWFSFESPALVHAAGSGDRALLDALIDLGADLEARSGWAAGPYSALHRLVHGATPESLDLAEHLVDRGAVVDLHAAAGMGRVERITEILDAAPHRVSEPGPDGATPLHLAKNVEVAALLLERGAEIDKRCVDHSSTPAMWAVQGREEVLRFLLERGASADLFQAALLNDVELATQILDADPDAIHVRVRFGESHPHLGNGDKYVWALDGADTPVELARRRDCAEVYEWLLSRSSTETRLLQACRRGDADTVCGILDERPDLLGTLPEPTTCEMLYGSATGARLLLERGAEPNVRDDHTGATALHHASWRGHAELAVVLLDRGADPSIRDRTYSSTPLGWANENGQDEMMALILGRHSPDIVDAAWLGNAERVRVILGQDPSLIDGLDGGNISPLRGAAWCGHPDVVRVLLSHGADVTRPNPETGMTALEMAVARGHDEIVALLSAI